MNQSLAGLTKFPYLTTKYEPNMESIKVGLLAINLVAISVQFISALLQPNPVIGDRLFFTRIAGICGFALLLRFKDSKYCSFLNVQLFTFTYGIIRYYSSIIENFEYVWIYMMVGGFPSSVSMLHLSLVDYSAVNIISFIICSMTLSSFFYSWNKPLTIVANAASVTPIFIVLLVTVMMGYQTRKFETERRAYENQLQDVAKKSKEENVAKTIFISNISHDLKTPVQAITGVLELLNETILTVEQVSYVSILASCCTNLMNIVNNVLDIGKIESEKLDVNEAPFNVFDLIQSVADCNTVLADQKNIDFVVQYNVSDFEKEYLTTDEKMLTRVLNNCTSNAIKFTDTGFVKIQLSLTVEGYVKFEISDSGAGMSKYFLDNKLFGLFSQENSNKRKQGSGLGLSLSRKLLRMLDSDFNVRSTSNIGSVFSFVLKKGLGVQSQFTNEPFHRIPISAFKNEKKLYILNISSVIREAIEPALHYHNVKLIEIKSIQEFPDGLDNILMIDAKDHNVMRSIRDQTGPESTKQIMVLLKINQVKTLTRYFSDKHVIATVLKPVSAIKILDKIKLMELPPDYEGQDGLDSTSSSSLSTKRTSMLLNPARSSSSFASSRNSMQLNPGSVISFAGSQRLDASVKSSLQLNPRASIHNPEAFQAREKPKQRSSMGLTEALRPADDHDSALPLIQISEVPEKKEGSANSLKKQASETLTVELEGVPFDIDVRPMSKSQSLSSTPNIMIQAEEPKLGSKPNSKPNSKETSPAASALALPSINNTRLSMANVFVGSNLEETVEFFKKTQRVLVAEDNPSLSLIIGKYFDMKQIPHFIAQNGRLAVEEFRKQPPNYYTICLLDVQMPEMDGLEATEEIRRITNDLEEQPIIIIMSALSTNEDMTSAIDRGANYYVTKPIQMNKLLMKLRTLLQ